MVRQFLALRSETRYITEPIRARQRGLTLAVRRRATGAGAVQSPGPLCTERSAAGLAGAEHAVTIASIVTDAKPMHSTAGQMWALGDWRIEPRRCATWLV